MPAARRVTKAVNEVLDLAPEQGVVSLDRLVTAVGTHRGRPIDVSSAELPPGVSGQWRQYADRDGSSSSGDCPPRSAPWRTNWATWCSATTGCW